MSSLEQEMFQCSEHEEPYESAYGHWKTHENRRKLSNGSLKMRRIADTDRVSRIPEFVPGTRGGDVCTVCTVCSTNLYLLKYVIITFSKTFTTFYAVEFYPQIKKGSQVVIKKKGRNEENTKVQQECPNYLSLDIFAIRRTCDSV